MTASADCDGVTVGAVRFLVSAIAHYPALTVSGDGCCSASLGIVLATGGRLLPESPLRRG
jgi:hypothetical protein